MVVLAIVALVASTPPARPATGLPTLLGDSPRGAGYYTWQVRPAHIVYTGDGSGILGGFDGSSARKPGHLTWSTWTRTEARGKGAVWLDDCNPDCADGRYTPHAVKVRAFRRVDGRFRRLTLDYRLKGKRYVDRRGISSRIGFWRYYIIGYPP